MEYQNKTFYKVVRKDLTHNTVIYKLGLNTDPLKFNPNGSCKSGGLYFTDIAHLGRFYKYGELVAIITIPEDARVYRDPAEDKWKADRFIIERFESIDSYWSDRTFCLEAVKRYGYALEHVKNHTQEICLEAVKQNGCALRHVEEQSHEICLEAVKQDGYALIYVENQTQEICLETVKRDGYALEYVENQTQEICLEAVKQRGYALRYVENQTQEICLEAVKQNADALRYVEKRFRELCLKV